MKKKKKKKKQIRCYKVTMYYCVNIGTDLSWMKYLLHELLKSLYLKYRFKCTPKIQGFYFGYLSQNGIYSQFIK